MIHYRERSIPVARIDSSVTLYLQGTKPNWNPPFAEVLTIPYKTPSFTRYFERFWWDDNRPFEWLPYNDNYRKQDKPCQHYKCYLADSAGEVLGAPRIPWGCDSLTNLRRYVSRDLHADRLLMVDCASFRSQFGAYGSHTAGLPSLVSDQKDLSFIIKPLGLNAMVSRSMNTMMPNIKSNLSLVNSIIELKDFKTLPHTLVSCYRYLRSIPSLLKSLGLVYKHFSGRMPIRIRDWRKVRDSFRAAEGLTLREIFRAPADGYLQAQFNVLPLLSDISAIFKSLSSLERTVKDMLQREGRLQVKHFNASWLPLEYSAANTQISYALNLEQFAGSTSPAGTTGCYNALYRSVLCRRRIIVDQSHFHAEVHFRYYLSEFQREHASVLALLDSLGVNLNPAIIWNAIPWSFVVDWVLGVSRWLKGRASLNMEPRISIENYLWSYKYKRRVRVSVETPNNADTPRISETYLPDLYEEAYRRDVVKPSFSDPIFSGSLSSTEVSLGVALAITRRRRPNTRMRG